MNTRKTNYKFHGLPLGGKIRRACLMAAGLSLSVSAYVNAAENVVVPPDEIVTVEVSSDTIWDKPVFVDGVLRKTGGGKLVLTGEKLYGHGKVEVAEGEIAVTATGAGSAAIESPAVLADAAMWLDASQHVAGPTGSAATSDAAKWFDVREANWAESEFATNHIYAEGVTTLADNAAWPSVGTDEASRHYVYFGGYGSGEHMVWRTPSGDLAWINVFQSFAAYNPDGTHGHYIGATYDTVSPRNGVYFAVNDGSASGTIFATAPNSAYNHLRNGRVFRNGERVAVSDSIDMNAIQIVETDSYPTGKPADAFFNFRDYQQKAESYSNGNRIGGGRLHEFVVFTNRIDETDRVIVAHWLLRKWVNTAGYGALPAFDVAKGATLTLPDVIAGAAKISSRGTFAVGGGAKIDSAALVDPFAGIGGVVVLDANAATTNLAGAAVATTPGKTYDVDAFNAVTVSAGVSGEVRKTGAGALALAGIGNATSLAVVEGTASLRAMPNGTDAVPSQNCLADGGFEGFSDGSTTYNNNAAIGAWTVTNYCFSASTRVLRNGYTAAVSVNIATPDGSNYLLLKQGGGVRQPVSLLHGGRYEVTLRVSQRSGYSGFARIYMDGILVGTAQSPSGQTMWDFVRFETPWIEAGDHVFTMSSEVTVDTAIGLDDVQLRWLDDVRAVAIPNANFEDADWVGGVEQPASQPRITSAINDTAVLSSAFLTKWAASGTVELMRGLPYLRSKSTFDAPDIDTGSITAYLHKDSCISQSVTIPEDGLYTLSALASCYVRNSSYSGFANGSIILTIGETSETIAIDNWSLKRIGLSSAIRLSQGDIVTVKIAAENVSTTYNEILVDDVRLERLPNLLANPGFEEGTTDTASKYPVGWTVVNPPHKTVYDAAGVDAGNFGTSYVEGSHRARLHSGEILSQTIPLAAGLYRLSFWDVSRVNNGKVDFGPTPISVALAKGAVTNFCETVYPSSFSTEAMRREFLVRVYEAGNWTLSFAATATGDKSSFIDAVCLVPADGIAPDAIPEVGDKPEVTVAVGARLGLDWPGILEALRVKCAGQSLKDAVTADLAPDSLYGIGAFNVKSTGFRLFVR